MDPHVFLRMVRGSVLPALFYGAPVWASVLSSSTRLETLDSFLATAARLAFSLERSTSSEAALVLAGLEPARYQIMRRLVCFHLCRHRSRLTDVIPPRTFLHHTSAFELGRTWFQRSVRGRTLTDPLPRRHRLIREGIDRALRMEWRARWMQSAVGSALREVFPRAGPEWCPVLPAAQGGARKALTLTARFLTCHCHFGEFSMPWGVDVETVCPFCGVIFSRTHMLWECPRLTRERVVLVAGVDLTHVGDLSWFAAHRARQLGRFLVAARQMAEQGFGS